MSDTITLRDFANGDTDYVAKMNANNAALADAIDALLAANGGSTGTLLSMGMLLLGLMRSGVVRLGTDGFGYTIVGETLVVDGGDAWRGESVRVMQSLGATLDFSGQTPGTWYVELADDGSLAIVASTASPVYSVVWAGSAFGAITLLAQTLFSSADETATLFSVIKNVLYATLEARLEALEINELMAADDTGAANVYQVSLPEVPAYRKYLVVIFQAAHANTGASTLEVDALGAIPLVNAAGALAAGEIAADQIVVAIHDGTNFQKVGGGGVVLTDPLTFKGVIDCSGNPNYPAADAGDVYRVSVAGKIGGSSGVKVEVGDVLLCIVDGTISGNQATVGADWTILQTNLDGVVIGPASATDGHLAVFDGASGKLIKDGGAPGVGVVRKVGITIDGAGSAIATGVKGSVQVDFAGTIIGWSIEADQSGSISVEIDKHAGTQTAPVVPNTTSDKISASAPVALASQQALGVGPAGVSTWTTAVAQWDSIGFNVVAATTVTRVTLYLRIQL